MENSCWTLTTLSGNTSIMRSAPLKPLARSGFQSIVARPVMNTASPLAKSRNVKPTRLSSSIFPSVLKNKLPEKSGKLKHPLTLSTVTKPGLPPRCETSVPLCLPCATSELLDAMKNVSALWTMAVVAASNVNDWWYFS